MNEIKEYTAQKAFNSNIGTYCIHSEVIPDSVNIAAIGAIQEYASIRCYKLLTELIDCKFGHGNQEGLQFRFQWLRDNIT